MENFGKKAKDKVTGFEGTITAICHYLYGCSQYLLTPCVDKEKKIQREEWFDTGRIKITGDGINPKSVKDVKDGCEFREHPSN
jgi:hypothetical protein